jgi:hypothetical protein
VSFTYADMQNRIASEMKRSDLLSDVVLGNSDGPADIPAGESFSGALSSIALAIQSAILQYQFTRFYFSELAYATWNTVENQEWYSTADGVPGDIMAIDTLTVIYNDVTGVRLPLVPREFEWVEFRQTGTLFSGIPTDYAYYQQQFRLFPIPISISPLYLAYWQLQPAPVNPTDAGYWMNDCEELIRCSAKRRLYAHVIGDPDEAAVQVAAEQDALRELRKITAMRTGMGKVAATQF